MSHEQHKRIVIVDGHSTGRELRRALAERAVECLHLRSTSELPAPVARSFDPSRYDADLGHLGTPEAAAIALAALRPDAVVAGSEWGVLYAEAVAERLGLPTNRPALRTARRDKFEMIEAVRAHGLLAAEQVCVGGRTAAVAWATARGRWPVVVKPLDSAGSDGVTICRSSEDIEAAFDSTLGRENFMGSRNKKLLVQEYLPGPQYIVNTVSAGGRHYVTDVWAMTVTLRGGRVVPGAIRLLDPRAARPAALIDYARKVLDALGIVDGAAHSELKWTPRGPALIETGARLMGAAMDEPSYRAADQRTQADVFAGVLTDSPAECDRLFARGTYERRSHIAKVLFNFGSDGEVAATAGLDRLELLPSFHAHYRALGHGARVWKTADWLACGGIVYLVHDDATQIERDIDTFRRWESNGQLYGVRARGRAHAIA